MAERVGFEPERVRLKSGYHADLPYFLTGMVAIENGCGGMCFFMMGGEERGEP